MSAVPRDIATRHGAHAQRHARRRWRHRAPAGPSADSAG